MQLTNENELLSQLQNLVSCYLEKNPGLTVNSLAQRANVPTSSLRRLLLGGQKHEIAPHSVLNIVSYIFREKNISKLITKIDRVIAHFLTKHFGHFVFVEKLSEKDSEKNRNLKDQTKFLIYQMALNHQGIDSKIIQNNFGFLGKKKLEEMLFDHILEEKEGRFYVTNKSDVISPNIVLEHLTTLLELKDAEFNHEKMNHFSHLTESLTKEAIDQILEIQNNALCEIKKIINDKNSLGDIPYFYLNLSEKMIINSDSN